MQEIIKKLNTWKAEATSFRNDGWMTAHYKALIKEVYDLSKEMVDELSTEDLSPEECAEESIVWLECHDEKC